MYNISKTDRPRTIVDFNKLSRQKGHRCTKILNITINQSKLLHLLFIFQLVSNGEIKIFSNVYITPGRSYPRQQNCLSKF